MKIIVSPAKKMKVCDDHGFDLSSPMFLRQAQALYSELTEMDPAALKKLYGCSDRMLSEILSAYQADRMRPEGHGELSPALLSYNGIAFRSMSPDTFSDESWDYVCRHLYVLSGLFGILRPLDGIWPYRLEMKSRLSPSLYDRWHPLTDAIFRNETILNLASREYSDLLPSDADVVNVSFYELMPDGSRKQPAVYSKIARGTMVRFLAENQIEELSELKNFDWLNYRFDPDSSDEKHYVFVRPSAKT